MMFFFVNNWKITLMGITSLKFSPESHGLALRKCSYWLNNFICILFYCIKYIVRHGYNTRGSFILSNFILDKNRMTGHSL